ncbi:hypothetical protein CP532_3063 [Ophiocordyceps camponoti-leonardi (nom. inval.)]|nr:hypothetical protein CP532_3063 [Ophiocordyceps camponoti-leonardi (nom. inval.)]
MHLTTPLLTLAIITPPSTLHAKADCYHRSGLCKWFGESPQCKPLVAGKTSPTTTAAAAAIYLRPGHRFRDPNDGNWYEIVTWTRNMSIHQLYYSLDETHPLHPGLQCYMNYGAGCWQGWKTLACRWWY